MYEIWYRDLGIPSVIFKQNLDQAVKAGVDVTLNPAQVLEALVGPEGEIRTDLVYEANLDELRRRKDEESKDNGTPWVVEVRHPYRDDVWGIFAEKPSEAAALGVSAQLGYLESGRVRVRQL